MDFQSQIALDSGRTFAADAPVSERLVFLRKTYLLTLMGLALAGVGGWLGATTLLPLAQKMFQGLGGLLLFLAVFLGAYMFARAVRKKAGLNYLAMFLFTFVAGVTLGPILFVATQMGGGQPTLVLQALIVTGFMITGLSGYVLVTRKDFSFLRGALSIGLFGLFGLVIVMWIFGIQSFGFHVLIAGGGALLFAGFTLYDTSRIVRTHPTDDPVGAALDLFIDFFYLFYYVLYLIMLLSGRND